MHVVSSQRVRANFPPPRSFLALLVALLTRGILLERRRPLVDCPQRSVHEPKKMKKKPSLFAKRVRRHDDGYIFFIWTLEHSLGQLTSHH